MRQEGPIDRQGAFSTVCMRSLTFGPLTNCQHSDLGARQFLCRKPTWLQSVTEP